jgi:hypothetical protein
MAQLLAEDDMADFVDSASPDLDGSAPSSTEQKAPGKTKPTKNLPTDRVGKDTQFAILRAYAKASEDQGKAAVSNGDVARFATISASSISVCNPFWNDAGLLVREGLKQRPVEAVFAYDQAAEWGSDRPMTKLAPVLASSWFGKPLLARLSLKPSTVNEALSLLAEECKASFEYKPQVQLLLDYMEAAGLIVVDGAMVSKVNRTGGDAMAGSDSQQDATASPQANPSNEAQASGTKRFAIPIPDKQDAVVMLPEDMDEEDWKMVSGFLTTYVNRWKKFSASKAQGAPSSSQEQ